MKRPEKFRSGIYFESGTWFLTSRKTERDMRRRLRDWQDVFKSLTLKRGELLDLLEETEEDEGGVIH